jgi:hypothetical protein
MSFAKIYATIKAQQRYAFETSVATMLHQGTKAGKKIIFIIPSQ